MWTMAEDKKAYEIGFMARDEKGASEIVERVKAHGGEILLEGPVEQVSLAYKIKKQAQAHFGYLHFAMEPANVKVFSDELQRVPNVLRFLVVTPPFEKQKPRQMPVEREYAASRPRAEERKTVAAPLPLSNEALEKKIEEILQQS